MWIDVESNPAWNTVRHCTGKSLCNWLWRILINANFLLVGPDLFILPSLVESALIIAYLFSLSSEVLVLPFES